MAICTESDIRLLEEQYQVVLPKEYTRFLRRSYPALEANLAGSDFHIHCLSRLREGALELLAENGKPFALEATDFVFLMHQGYQFLFFRCGGSDDPSVYHYLEGDSRPTKKFDRFTEWIALCNK